MVLNLLLLSVDPFELMSQQAEDKGKGDGEVGVEEEIGSTGAFALHSPASPLTNATNWRSSDQQCYNIFKWMIKSSYMFLPSRSLKISNFTVDRTL